MLHLWYIVFTFTGDKEATVVHNRTQDTRHKTQLHRGDRCYEKCLIKKNLGFMQ